MVNNPKPEPDAGKLARPVPTNSGCGYPLILEGEGETRIVPLFHDAENLVCLRIENLERLRVEKMLEMLVKLPDFSFLEQNLIHRKEIVAIILEDLENLEIFYYFEVVGESEVEKCF